MDENNIYSKDNRSSGKEANGYVDGIYAYRQDMGETPVLNSDEVKKLAKIIKYGTEKEAKEARDKLIKSNLRLVYSYAQRHVSEHYERLDDAIQNGNLGLMRAVETFDYTKGYEFSTYAVWWIKQHINRAEVDSVKNIRLPIQVHERVVKLNRIKTDFLTKYHKEPSIEELANIMEIPEKTVIELMNFSKDAISLETPISDDDEGSKLGDFIPDEDKTNDSSNIENKVLIENLLKDAPITQNENKVIRLRYGISGGRGETLEEISEYMKISRERVRQIEARALDKIRIFARRHPRYRGLFKP